MIQGLNTLKFLMSQQEPTQEHPVNASPRGGVTRQGVVLPSFSHFLIVNKTSPSLARPLYQGGWGSVWDPEPSKDRIGDWGGPATVWFLLCVAERVPQGRTESGGIVLAANAGPRVPSGGVTLKRRCTYQPSVNYLIVNKLFSLSLLGT